MPHVSQIHSSVRLYALPDSEAVVAIARTLEDLMQAASIRARTYMAEQDCPWAEEFDQNDLCAMHLILRKGAEPVGTLRLRFFGEFVKLERLAVLPAHRRGGLARRLVKEALRIASQKGFKKIYIHAQADAVSFWEGLGFHHIDGRPSFVFSGYPYVEMTRTVSSGAPLGLNSPPMVLNRPEGDWDIPGPMEGGAAGMDVAAND